MTAAAEAFGQQSPIKATLDRGIEQLSEVTTVTFTRYNKMVLSDDGSVFWVATGTTKTVKGSFHYATDRFQDEDQTIGANQVIFTSELEVTEFNVVTPSGMWIGTWAIADSPALKVVFGGRGRYAPEADIWHYVGYAVYPAMETQILSSAGDIPTGPIVSNSTPIFRTLGTIPAASLTVPVYTSYLVPDNAAPPYVVVHVGEGDTEVIGGFPVHQPWPGTPSPPYALQNLPSQQLCRDKVRLTLYGFNNQLAIQYRDMLVDASGLATFGFANTPAIRDAKRTQREIATVAQKKMIEVEANYYQATADAAGRRLILQAFMSIEVVPAA